MARPDRIRAAWLAATVACALAASPVAAQNAGAAEALFNKGMAQMKAGDYEAACPALEESHRLDPKPGVLFTLAACEAKRGRVATAVTRYEDYLEIVASLTPAERTRQKAREKAARREKEELAAKVPTLTVLLPSSAQSEVVVKRDGEVMGKPSFGVPLPLDPGEHVVTVHSGDTTVLTERVVLGPGEHRTVKLPATFASAKRAEDPTAKTGDGDGGDDAGPKGDGASAGSLALPIAAFVVGGVGIGVGSVFGLMALGKKSVVDDECDGTQCRSEEGKSAGETGNTFGTVSTIGFVVGGIGVAAGVTLLLVRDTGKPAGGANGVSSRARGPAGGITPDVVAAPGRLGVRLRGSF